MSELETHLLLDDLRTKLALAVAALEQLQGRVQPQWRSLVDKTLISLKG